MPAQDGLRFLFDIQDKISAKLAKIEKKSKSSAAKIDRAFTRASRSQEKNSARAVAAEQRRIAAVNKAHAQAIKLLKRESDAFKKSMTRLATAATVAFAVVSRESLSMASGYDKAMRSVRAKTGATGKVLDKLSKQAREMGRTTVHSATEAARGQAFLAQAGFDANEILSALPATLALATAGELGLADAADIASNVVSGFRLEIKDTGHVADVLAKSAASANTNVAEMGAAMAKAAPSAASAGWSLEQTAAAIGVLADNAIKGEEGGTLLKTMLAKLAPTTGATAKKLKILGIEVHTTTGRVKPLDEILQALAPHTDNTGLMFELLGTRGANAGLILGSLAKGELAKLTRALEDSEGAAQEMADIMSGGLWGAIKKIQSIAESAFITFGERLAPAVILTANVFGDLPGPIQEVVVVTVSLVAAMGGLMLIMPQSFGSLVQLPRKLALLVTSINLVRVRTIAMTVAQKAATAAQWLMNAAMKANPIGLVIAAIGLLVVAWLKWDDEIMSFLRGTWNLVKKGFNAFKGWVTEAFGVLKGWLDKIPTPILALMGPVGLVLATFKHWDDIPRIAKAAYEGIKTWLSDKLGAIFDGVKSKVDAVVGFFRDMKDIVVGNSIVPDMVNLVGSEFGRMRTMMTEETNAATAAVTASMEGMTGKTEGWMSRFKDTMTGSLKSMLKGITGGEGISGMLTGIGKGVVDGIGNLVSGGLASLANLALKGLVAVGKKLWGTIKGWFSRGKRKREKAAAEEKARIAEVTRVAEEAAAKQAAAAEKAAEEQKRYWDSIYSAAISAYDRSKAAGVAAYDEIFLAAVESGAGQEEAVAKATAAQEEASAKILAAEGEKFARLAAFEAALEAIRSGNAAGAADAAALAAAQTRTAWETAMDAVKVADQAAGDAMIDTANKVAAIQEKQAAAAAAAQEAAAKKAKDAWTWEPPDSSGDDDIPGGFQDPEGYDGFQHGGPVQAGKPILVGEAGPELFIPSQGGRIDPNVSSAGGGVNAKELAAAVASAMQGTRLEVDGRQFGRLTIRHQPVAVAELGGRR